MQVAATRVPTGSQNYSLVITGPPGMQQILGNECRDCLPGNRLPCPIANGVGEKKCLSNGKFSSCFATTCVKGYTLSSWTNKCRKFADYYLSKCHYCQISTT